MVFVYDPKTGRARNKFERPNAGTSPTFHPGVAGLGDQIGTMARSSAWPEVEPIAANLMDGGLRPDSGPIEQLRALEELYFFPPNTHANAEAGDGKMGITEDRYRSAASGRSDSLLSDLRHETEDGRAYQIENLSIVAHETVHLAASAGDRNIDTAVRELIAVIGELPTVTREWTRVSSMDEVNDREYDYLADHVIHVSEGPKPTGKTLREHLPPAHLQLIAEQIVAEIVESLVELKLATQDKLDAAKFPAERMVIHAQYVDRYELILSRFGESNEIGYYFPDTGLAAAGQPHVDPETLNDTMIPPKAAEAILRYLGMSFLPVPAPQLEVP